MSALKMRLAACFLVVLYSIGYAQRGNPRPQSCVRADAGPDQTVCGRTGVTIGTPASTGMVYFWSPANGLSNAYTAQPTATPTNTTTYTLTVVDPTTNLIQNGHFESGMTGFGTDYGVYPNGNASCVTTPGGTSTYGSLSVTTSPSALSSIYCNRPSHPPAGRYALFVDGSCVPNQRVWYQQVNVQQNATYSFMGWVGAASNSSSSLRVVINGVTMIQYFRPSSDNYCADWRQMSCSWNSGTGTTALIEIYDDDLDRAGNDIWIDDLYFSTCYSADNVTVQVAQASTPVISPSGPITYYNQFETQQYLTLTSSSAPNYQWYKNGVAISGANSQTYTIGMIGLQTYTDYYTVGTSCSGSMITSSGVQFNYRGCQYDNEYPISIVRGICESQITPPNSFQLPPANPGSNMTNSWYFTWGSNTAGVFTITPQGQVSMTSSCGYSYGCSGGGIYYKSSYNGEELYLFYSGIYSIPGCRTANTDNTSTIYPNPTKTNSSVIIQAHENIQKVEVCDWISGKVIRSFKGTQSNRLQLPTLGINEGFYNIRVTLTTQRIDVLKLFIEK